MSDVRLVIASYGYDGVVDVHLQCRDCDQGLPWPGDQPLSQPTGGWSPGGLKEVAAGLAQVARDHWLFCTPNPPPGPPPVMVKPVITPDPEPVLGERRIKLGGRGE